MTNMRLDDLRCCGWENKELNIKTLLGVTLVLIGLAAGGCGTFPVEFGTRCGEDTLQIFENIGTCTTHDKYSMGHWASLARSERETQKRLHGLNAGGPPSDEFEDSWIRRVEKAEKNIVAAAGKLVGQVVVFCFLLILWIWTIVSVPLLWKEYHKETSRFRWDKILTSIGSIVSVIGYGSELYYTHGFGHIQAHCQLLDVLCGGHCDLTKRSLLVKTWGIGALFLLLAAFSFIMDGILIFTLVRLRKDIVEYNEDLKKMEKLETEEKEKTIARRRQRGFLEDCHIEFAVPRSEEDKDQLAPSGPIPRQRTHHGGVPTKEYILNMPNTLQSNLVEFLPTMKDTPTTRNFHENSSSLRNSAKSDLRISMHVPALLEKSVGLPASDVKTDESGPPTPDKVEPQIANGAEIPGTTTSAPNSSKAVYLGHHGKKIEAKD